MTAAFIALDWGTSSFRAYLVTAAGDIVERREAAAGILAVENNAFDQEMERHIGAWDRSLPVIASGMITSRQGWVEVAYASCPAGAAELSAGLVEKQSHEGRTIYFVPGLMHRSRDGVPDVMRGEEVQVIGASQGAHEFFIAPGTHSKWITVSDGSITSFRTYMTGEIFALLRQHSILSRLMNGQEQVAQAFDAGVAKSLAAPQALLHDLFSVRTLPLFGEMAETRVASYLSGLLIGAEVGHAIAQVDKQAEFTLLASAQLGQTYLRALEIAGLKGKVAASDIVVKGLAKIMRAKGLIK